MEAYVKELAANPYVQIAAIVASILAFAPVLFRWIKAILKFARALLIDGPRNAMRRIEESLDRRAEAEIDDIRLVVITLFLYSARIALSSFLIVVFSFLAVLTKSVDLIGLDADARTVVKVGTVFYWIAVYIFSGQVFLNIIWGSQYCWKIRKKLLPSKQAAE